MSDDRLAEIKRLMEHMVPSDDGFDDIDWLVAEVERLRVADAERAYLVGLASEGREE